MPKFGVRMPHTLSQEEAHSPLERFAEMLQEKFATQVSDLQQSWEGDTLRFISRPTVFRWMAGSPLRRMNSTSPATCRFRR